MREKEGDRELKRAGNLIQMQRYNKVFSDRERDAGATVEDIGIQRHSGRGKDAEIQ